MTYHAVYLPEALHGCDEMPRNIRDRIRVAIEKRLLQDPFKFGEPLRLSMRGFRKLRVGDYRVIYLVRKQTVIVARIGHRKEVYETQL